MCANPSPVSSLFAEPRDYLCPTEAAKHAAASTQSNVITPMQSIAAVMQGRGERYRERIAGVSERVVGHIEAMCPDEILTRSAQFEKSTRLHAEHLD